MLTETHRNDSGEHSQSDLHLGRTRAREVGRSLASIGDSLNQEMQARRTVERAAVTLVFQLASLGGVNISFSIPMRVSFHYETDVSLLVYIISFYTSREFIRVRDA